MYAHVEVVLMRELRMYAVLRTEPGRAHAEQALSYWARSQPNNEL